MAAAARAVAAELDAVIAEARRLLSDHRAQAAGAAARIRAAAADPPYRKPGLLERLRDRAHDWIATHAEVLTQIARGVRLAIDGARHRQPGAAGSSSSPRPRSSSARPRSPSTRASSGPPAAVPGPGLAADATLTVLPTGPVARMVRAAPGVAGGLKAVNRAIPPAFRGRVFRAVGNLPEGITSRPARRRGRPDPVRPPAA